MTVDPKAREIYPQLDFFNEENYSFSIESITTDQLIGCFYLKSLGLCYPFNGLLSKLNDQRFRVTFSINWNHEELPSSSIFSGYLILEMDKGSSLMELDWLHVNQGNETTHSWNGFSKIPNQSPIILHTR